jgi:hypothetical protein
MNSILKCLWNHLTIANGDDQDIALTRGNLSQRRSLDRNDITISALAGIESDNGITFRFPGKKQRCQVERRQITSKIIKWTLWVKNLSHRKRHGFLFQYLITCLTGIIIRFQYLFTHVRYIITCLSWITLEPMPLAVRTWRRIFTPIFLSGEMTQGERPVSHNYFFHDPVCRITENHLGKK